MNRVKPIKFLIMMSLCLAGLILASVFIGPARIPMNDIFEERFFDILKLRILRTILAVAAGAGLSLSGVALQAILRNPLAEPYILGVSSGAGLGAVMGLLLLPISGAVSVIAFIGGLITIMVVYLLARVDKRILPENLIIAGILVNALFSGLLMFFVSNSSSAKIHSVIWWLLGNLQVYSPGQVLIAGAVVSAGSFVVFILSKELNAISLGEEEALHLGVDIEKIKAALILAVTLITSVIVSMCGIIGFVGLMVPHIARRLVGPDHRILVPASILTGGVFILSCDIFARTIMAPRELPVGVITTLLGVPFFIYVLKKSGKAYFK
ncbi:MAG: iron ABC transporter permease [Candidatus Omnitrophota bacterium]